MSSKQNFLRINLSSEKHETSCIFSQMGECTLAYTFLRCTGSNDDKGRCPHWSK